MDIPGKRQWIAVLWPSFVCAGVFSGLLFAFIDPLVLAHELAIESSPRLAIYTVSFWFFWIMCAISTRAAIAIVATPAVNPLKQ